MPTPHARHLASSSIPNASGMSALLGPSLSLDSQLLPAGLKGATARTPRVALEGPEVGLMPCHDEQVPGETSRAKV